LKRLSCNLKLKNIDKKSKIETKKQPLISKLNPNVINNINIIKLKYLIKNK